MSSITELLPEDTLVWLDSSDMYKERDFYAGLQKFSRIYLDIPLARKDVESIIFNIAPQPTFNKNFELLTEDIRRRLEEGYRVRIYGEKKSQLERLQSILMQNGGILPEFISVWKEIKPEESFSHLLLFPTEVRGLSLKPIPAILSALKSTVQESFPQPYF